MTDRDEWIKRYVAQLVKRGLTLNEAWENADAMGAAFNENDSPEDSANDEISYLSEG